MGTADAGVELGAVNFRMPEGAEVFDYFGLLVARLPLSAHGEHGKVASVGSLKDLFDPLVA